MNSFIAPKAGENISVNKPYNIRWSPTSPGPVFIQLSYDNNIKATNITVSTPNTGSYSWTPVDVFEGRNNYFLVICDLNLPQNTCSYTLGGRFAIGFISSSTSSTISGSSTPTSDALSSPSTTPTSVNATQQTVPTSTSTPPIQTSTPNPDPGLSTVAKAAIGAIVPILVLVVIGLAVFFIWRQRKGGQPASSDAGVMREYHKAELATDGHAKESIRAELSGSGAHDGYGSERADVQELAGGGVEHGRNRSEMRGDGW